MKKILNYTKKHKKTSIIGGIVLIIVLFFLFSGGDKKVETFTVALADVEQSVALSGKIETTDKADLGFAASGRVAKIFVKNNQAVSEGALLAQLEIGDLLADLDIKQANSKTSDVDLEAAKDELEKVTKQEDTKVKNAYRTLLTDDLELIPDVVDYDVDAPTLGGLYDGPEGQYKVTIDKENEAFPDFRLRVFSLEKMDTIVNEEGSTPLGTRGLYVSFPQGDLSSYEDTIWFLNIPNKTSSSYLSNLNAYNEAKNARDLAIKDAQAEYDKLVTRSDSGSTVAEAEIQKIRAEIRKNSIYAPFTGRVTNIEKEVGESASVGEQIVTVLGENKLEVVLQVSELDVSKLEPGLPISITLDAFPGENFKGVLKTINSRDTKVDGVPVYEAFVELEPDARIKTGMNASGLVVLAHKDSVLAVPTYVIEKENGEEFVQVMLDNGSLEKRKIMTGLSGTDSMIEVISGLEEGQKVLVSGSK